MTAAGQVAVSERAFAVEAESGVERLKPRAPVIELRARVAAGGLGFEGSVLKRRDGRYRPGERS